MMNSRDKADNSDLHHVQAPIYLPDDVISIIASFIPEVNELVKLRAVSKQYKRLTDEIVLAPDKIANLIFTLDKKQLLSFHRYYQNTPSYIALRQKTELNVIEKICCAFGAGYINQNVKEIYTKEFFRYLDDRDILEIVSQLSSLAARRFLLCYRNCNEKYFRKIESYMADPGERNNYFGRNDTWLMAVACYALSTLNITEINPIVLSHAIQYISELKLDCSVSLKIILAAIKRDKSKEDYETIRQGAKTYINLAGADLRHAKLNGAKLAAANLYHTRFDNAALSGADLRSTNLYWTWFPYANLENANLQKSRMEHTMFNYANLTGTNLTDAHMQEVEINNAILVGTNFTNVDMGLLNWEGEDSFTLTQSNLNNTKWLRPEYLFLNLNLKNQLDYWFDITHTRANVHEFRQAIALDLIRITSHIDDHSTAIDMLTYAIEKSSLFQHRDKFPRALNEAIGLFTFKSAISTNSGGLLIAEKERRISLRDAMAAENNGLSVGVATLCRINRVK